MRHEPYLDQRTTAFADKIVSGARPIGSVPFSGASTDIARTYIPNASGNATTTSVGIQNYSIGQAPSTSGGNILRVGGGYTVTALGPNSSEETDTSGWMDNVGTLAILGGIGIAIFVLKK